MAGITVPRETSLVGTHLLDRRAGRTLSLASIAHNPANLAPFSNSSPQLCVDGQIWTVRIVVLRVVLACTYNRRFGHPVNMAVGKHAFGRKRRPG